MYLFDVYFRNKIKQKTSNYNHVQNYNKVFLGVNLMNINYVRKCLGEGNRCLLIFEKDILEDTQPNFILGSSFLFNLLFFYLKNISLNHNEDSLRKNQIRENYTNLINIYNLNYKYFSKKYQNNIQKFNLTIENNFGSFFKRILFQMVINYELYKNNFEGSFLKFHKNFLFLKSDFIQVNQIILNEIFEMKNEFKDKLEIKSYSDIKEIHISGNDNYLINIFDKFDKTEEKLSCDEIMVFKNISKRDLTFSNEGELNQDFFLNKRCFLNLNTESDGINLNLFELKHIDRKNKMIKETFDLKSKEKYFFELLTKNQNPYKHINEAQKNIDSVSNTESFIKYFISSRLKYIRMKTKKFNNIIEEEIMRSSLALSQNSLTQQKLKDEMIKKIVNLNLDEFLLLPSKSNSNKVIEEYTQFLNQLNESSKFEKKSLEITIDDIRMHFNEIDKNTIKTLLQSYDTKTTKEILIQNYRNKESILKTQIRYEINNRYLKHPVDFLSRRHNYLAELSNPSLNLFTIISPFVEQLHYPYDTTHQEIFKLLSLKYLNYS